jgi:hypothetical protein
MLSAIDLIITLGGGSTYRSRRRVSRWKLETDESSVRGIEGFERMELIRDVGARVADL